MTPEVQALVIETAERAREQSGWRVGEILDRLGVRRSSYYRWRGRKPTCHRRESVHSVLDWERRRKIALARHQRKETNLGKRQRTLPFDADTNGRNHNFQKPGNVSL